MTRIPVFAAALAGVLVVAPARGDVAIAPPPREVKTDGARALAPGPAAPAESPAETVDRIIKTSKAVGDKLARTDTGTDTRAGQDKILKDIDTLLNPPPQSGGGAGDKNDQKEKNKDKDQDKTKNPDQSPGGAGDKPMGGKNPGGGNGNGGGGGPASNGDRRPRPGGPAKDPGGAAGGNQPGPSKGQQAGRMSVPAKPPDAVAVKPSLPLDDDVVKEVWGHLPDKLRQQVSQYYKEQFMPRYSDLLKQYYSSLANGAQKPAAARK